MRKYGFLKHSLVDYPGEVCSVVFLPDCNFHCPYCHNKLLGQEIAQNGWFLKDIVRYLQEAKRMITAVCITGGEPTLFPETLVFLVETFKGMGFKVKIDTNGSHPQQIETLSPVVDYFAMDLKTSLKRYQEITKIEAIDKVILDAMQLLLQRNPNSFEFRTTLDWNFVDEGVVEKLGLLVRKNTRWFFQRCRGVYALSQEAYADETQRIKNVCKLAKKYTNFVFLRE